MIGIMKSRRGTFVSGNGSEPIFSVAQGHFGC